MAGIDWVKEMTPEKMSLPIDEVVCVALFDLCAALKIEMKDQETSRSMRKYKEELLEAAGMVIKHYTAPIQGGRK